MAMKLTNSSPMMHPQTQSQHFSLARGLASLGRGNDTNLVHLSDKELNGLQHLAMRTGGSLTVNPHTGLYEAGWLENILPMVAGGALAMTGVGAPAAALMVAAADTAMTKGNWKSGLAAGLGAFGGAGLASGLAGAGASAAASGAAGSAGTTAATTAASQAAATAAASDAGAQAAGSAATDATTDAIANDAATQAIPAGVTPSSLAVPSDIASPAAPTLGPIQTQAEANQAAMSGGFGNSASNVGKGIASLGSTPGSTASDIYASTGKIGLAGLAAPAAYNNYSQPSIPAPNKPFTYYTDTYNQGSRNPYFGELGQSPLAGQGYGTPTINTFTPQSYAGGGEVDPIGPGKIDPTNTNVAPPASQGAVAAPPNDASQQQMIQYYQQLANTPTNAPAQPPSPDAQNAYLAQLNQQIKGAPGMSNSQPASTAGDTAVINNSSGNAASSAMEDANSVAGQAYETSWKNGLQYDPATGTYTNANSSSFKPPVVNGAAGGLASLGHYSDGGQMLKGPGDGMSDSIPARIGSQPAALANDEFVIPADVVSHIGNGSSDAGSRKLYAMMDRVRKARTGSAGQAPKINADKMMPA
jgi:hypothetical protein